MPRSIPWKWFFLARMIEAEIVHKNKLNTVIDFLIPNDFIAKLNKDLTGKFSPFDQQLIIVGCWLALRTVGSNKGMETVRDAILCGELEPEMFLKPNWCDKLLAWATPIDKKYLPTVGYTRSRVNILTGKNAMFKYFPECLWYVQTKLIDLLKTGNVSFISITNLLATLPNHGPYWSCQGARLLYLSLAQLHNLPIVISNVEWDLIDSKMPGTMHGAEWLNCTTFSQMQLLCTYLNATLPGKNFNAFDLSVQFCEVMQIDKVFELYGQPLISESNYKAICDISPKEGNKIKNDVKKERCGEQKFGETFTIFEEHLKRKLATAPRTILAPATIKPLLAPLLALHLQKRTRPDSEKVIPTMPPLKRKAGFIRS